MKNTYKILIVDDHPMVLEGMKNIIDRIDGVEVVGMVTEATKAFQFIKANEVHLVITDINIPDISGIDLCRQITAKHAEIKVLGMSTFHDTGYVSEMLKAGALGFMTKNASLEEIEEAILKTKRGEIYVGAVLSTQKPLIVARSGMPVLTMREKEVLKLISNGLTNKEIATKLFLSINTVDSHRKNIFHKFDVMNAASLIEKANKFGMI